MRTDRRGFTLVELLVVIGIIAVMIGILVPALSKARAAAQTTQCLSNQRTNGMAIQMYTTESKGYLPPYRLPIQDLQPGAVYTAPYWFQYLPHKYFKSNGATWGCPSDDFYTHAASGITGNKRGPYSNMAGVANIYFSYAFNGALPRRATPIYPPANYPFFTISYQVVNPTPMTMLRGPAEVAFSVETKAGAILYHASAVHNFRFDHGPKKQYMTVCYADGHAELATREQVMAPSTDPKTWPPGFARFWLGRPDWTQIYLFP